MMNSPLRTLGLLVSVSVLALTAPSAEAASAPKKEAKSYKITGRIQGSYSTDRNAGIAPATERMAGDDFEDEDDGDADMEMDFDDDVFDELDLDDQNLLDQLDETDDEDGDGNFFDDDEDFEPGDDPGDNEEVDDGTDADGDGDGDGFDDGADADGDGIPDGVDGDADGDGVPDGAPVDPVDPAAVISTDPQAVTAGGRRRASPSSIRDERFTLKGSLGYTQKIGTWAKEWKTGAQIATSSFDTLTKSDTTLFGLNTGPVFKVKSLKAQFMPSFMYANLRKDGEFIFNNYGGALAGAFDLSKHWKLGLRYGYDVREFEDNAIDAIGAYSTAANLKYVIQKNQAVVLGLRTRLEATAPAARAKDATQVTLAYQQKWQNGWYVRPAVGYAWIERDSAAKRNQPIRKDERATFNLAVGRDIGYGINIEGQYSNMDTDVNLIGRDSANDRFVLLTGWKF